MSEHGAAPESLLPAEAARAHGGPRWTGGRMAALAGGSLLALIGLALLAGGGTGVWADLTQRDGGYVTTGVHEFSTSGSALATEPTQLGAAGVEWLYSPALLGTVRIRVTPLDTGSALFVGIGRSSDVDRYLAGVDHTVISDFFGNKLEAVPGGSPRSAPAAQRFWVASTTGRGTRTLNWKPHGGSWTVVVMNAAGQAGLGVRADLGARMPSVLWVALGLLALGVVFFAGGALLVAGAVRGRRAGRVGDDEGGADAGDQ